MKNFLRIAAASIGLLSVFTLSSCEEDKCKSVVCANSGNCEDDGSCTCPVGYEGDRCETITREKFKGVWGVAESGSISGPISYAVSVENGANINELQIRNFQNFYDAKVTAYVVGDSIFIPEQQVVDQGDTKTIVGRGAFDIEYFYGLHGKLILRYKVTNSDQSVNNFGMDGAENPSIWTK